MDKKPHFVTCKICDREFRYNTGDFTLHLNSDHNIDKEQYIVITEYNGIHPKCECGYCDDLATFQTRKNTFLKIKEDHRSFEWIQQKYIEKYGQPKCCNPNCDNSVKFSRGIPNKYCSFKCLPNRWNQDKKDKTVKEKYGVDNVFQLDSVKQIIIEKLTPEIRKESSEKSSFTKLEKSKLGIDAYGIEKQKETAMINYGVDHFSKTQKFRKDSSNRMKENNPMKNENVVNKMSRTRMNNLENGDLKLFNTFKYKDTDLYYQSSYEKLFLDLCESLNILHKINRSKSYEWPEKYRKYGIRFLPDFYLENYNLVVEIKSTYIKNIQGGDDRINDMKKTIESHFHDYLIILDNNFDEFIQIVKLYEKT